MASDDLWLFSRRGIGRLGRIEHEVEANAGESFQMQIISYALASSLC